jgi:hypothetical protein
MLNLLATLLDGFQDPVTIGLLTTIGVFVALIGLAYIAFSGHDNGFKKGFFEGFKSKHSPKPTPKPRKVVRRPEPEPDPEDEYSDDEYYDEPGEVEEVAPEKKVLAPVSSSEEEDGPLTVADAILSQASKRKARRG